MKLKVRFIQLPVLFDAAKLAEEVSRVREAAWRPHPMGFAGNDALPLIARDGNPASDDWSGPMRPTPQLLACPYLMQVLDRLGGTWGRTRLMRLSGQAEVQEHVDTDYYWRERMRVHVPITTQPTVQFHCGGEQVNMAAGQCWIFDTWSLHKVINDNSLQRIHLVADTVGGERLLDLIERGRTPVAPPPADWWPEHFAPQGETVPVLNYESLNVPKVMTPWEMRDHFNFLLSEAVPSPSLGPVAQSLHRLLVIWHSIWSAHGEADEGLPAYRNALGKAWNDIAALKVDDLLLKNEMNLGSCLRKIVFNVAVDGATSKADLERREAPQRILDGPLPSGAMAAPGPSPTAAPSAPFSVKLKVGQTGTGWNGGQR